MKRAAHVPPLTYVDTGNPRWVNLFGHTYTRLNSVLENYFTSDSVRQHAR